MNKFIKLARQVVKRLKKRLKPQRGDDYGYEITEPPEETNPYKYAEIYKRLEDIIGDFDLREMKKIVGLDFGINPFDLFVLKSFIERNDVKLVLELGAGTSSMMLDNMKIARKSFAL